MWEFWKNIRGEVKLRLVGRVKWWDAAARKAR
jgi:hypothetical protein